MIDDISNCYRILELEPGATLEAVKRSYRELVKVWHPDRFPNDPKLQKKGEEKLKQINSAYEQICERGFPNTRPRPSSAGPSAPPAGEQAKAAGSTGSPWNRSWTEPEGSGEPPPPRSQPKSSPEIAFGRRLLQVAVTFVIFVVLKAVFSTGNGSKRQIGGYSGLSTRPIPSTLPPEKSASFEAKVTPTQVVSPKMSSPAMQSEAKVRSVAVLEQPTTAGAASSTAHQAVMSPQMTVEDTTKVGKFAPQSNLVGAAPSGANLEFFTIGSTKDEVLAVQGTPTQFNDSTFTYGASTIHFENGRVDSWYDGYPKLKVRLLPSSNVEAPEFFTIGSTKDEVLAIQGTPTQLSDSTFTYGASTVRFKGGKVESWYDGYPKLKVKLPSASKAAASEFFTIGSTKDEVLAVQGTPTQFNDSTFTYGASTVHFENGRVDSWYDGYPKLKVKLLPSSNVEASELFTIGSTKDEVLAIQGTPTQLSDSTFTYGASTVRFKDGRVESWYDGYPKLKVRTSEKSP